MAVGAFVIPVVPFYYSWLFSWLTSLVYCYNKSVLCFHRPWEITITRLYLSKRSISMDYFINRSNGNRQECQHSQQPCSSLGPVGVNVSVEAYLLPLWNTSKKNELLKKQKRVIITQALIAGLRTFPMWLFQQPSSPGSYYSTAIF